ncbi:MAG: cupin domain-containing protein, partial [Planctomycetota bacterium]
HLKAAKLKGEFVWHQHDDTDELFWVVSGSLRMRFRDREIQINEGELIVVPKGVEHQPVADDEVHVVMIEKQGTVNTGDSKTSDKTVLDLEHL